MDLPQQRLEQLQRQLKIQSSIVEQVTCPKASLQQYRSKSTIDQQSLKEHFYGRNWEYREKCFNLVKEDPQTFRHQHIDESSRSEQRLHSFEAVRAFYLRLGLDFVDFARDPNIVTMTSAAMYCYDAAVCVKFGVHFHLYAKTIMNLGTEKHLAFLERAKTMDDIGSFALTELGHGSNVRNLLTTAIFDRVKGCFILNTPDDMAMKFWIGATANLANMTAVFAQLYIDDKEYGVHAFLVEIRDKSDHMVKDGIIIGDCGPKNGNNGIDNGFLIFKNLEVPLDNLLDKFSAVSRDGVFTASIEDPDKRFAVQLGSLSGGRVMLSMYGAIAAINSLTIALRYSTVRKQFGAPNEPESSIIEYPLTQLRLIPSLATALVHLNSSVKLTLLWDDSQAIMFDPNNAQLAEVHAISSALKGVTNNFANEVTMECRQMLGGHGYHLYNRLGTMLADTDINVTWEGDTNVLMQQTAKFLLEAVNRLVQGKEPKYETLRFMRLALPETRFTGDTAESMRAALMNYGNLCHAIEVRCNALVLQSGLKFQKNLKTKGDMFDAWNSTQPFYLQRASRAYADVYCMQEWVKANTQANPNSDTLLQIFQLWALSIMEKDYALYRDINLVTSKHIGLIRDLILELCSELKSQVIGITDSLSPPDEVLASPFGKADGDVYNTYLKLIYQNKDCFTRVPWWQMIHPQKH